MQLDDLRFGSGLGFIRNAEQYGNQEPSAHGLQRITNSTPYFPSNFWPLTYSMPTSYYPSGTTPAPPYSPALAEVVGDVFASPDDPSCRPTTPGSTTAARWCRPTSAASASRRPGTSPGW